MFTCTEYTCAQYQTSTFWTSETTQKLLKPPLDAINISPDTIQNSKERNKTTPQAIDGLMDANRCKRGAIFSLIEFFCTIKCGSMLKCRLRRRKKKDNVKHSKWSDYILRGCKIEKTLLFHHQPFLHEGSEDQFSFKFRQHLVLWREHDGQIPMLCTASTVPITLSCTLELLFK